MRLYPLYKLREYWQARFCEKNLTLFLFFFQLFLGCNIQFCCLIQCILEIFQLSSQLFRNTLPSPVLRTIGLLIVAC